jgi:nicotinamide-nucleotide amidase
MLPSKRLRENSMTTDIEIVCVGNELLIGKVQNTNAYWLAKQATQIGANVTRVTVIRDIVAEIAATIREAVARKPKFIVTTGGLGPTFDDKTLQGIAQALDRKLEVNPQALAIVEQRCASYARAHQLPTQIELTPPRVKMATLPEKTEPLNNPVGTAPGVRADMEETMLFTLPGVPAEMEAIFTENIAPLIKVAAAGNVFYERSLFAEAIVESRLAPLIDRVMNDNAGVYIKSHPTQTQIEAHLTITAKPEENPAQKLQKAADELAALIVEHGGRARTGT